MAAERAEDVAKWKDGEEEANAAELRFRRVLAAKPS